MHCSVVENYAQICTVWENKSFFLIESHREIGISLSGCLCCSHGGNFLDVCKPSSATAEVGHSIKELLKESQSVFFFFFSIFFLSLMIDKCCLSDRASYQNFAISVCMHYVCQLMENSKKRVTGVYVKVNLHFLTVITSA